MQLLNPESQTLHLVLRPTGVEPPTFPPAPLAGPQRVPTPILNPLQARPQSTPIVPIHGVPTQLPHPGLQQTTQHQLLHQADHLQNMMVQRLQTLQQETVRLQQDMMNIEQRSRALAAGHPGLFPSQQPAMVHAPHVNPGLPGQFQLPNRGFMPHTSLPASVQTLIAQQQRDRAAEGRQGAQDTGFGASLNGGSHPGSGRASPNILRPDHHTTHTREGVGPNGERWHITVNETTTTFPIATGVPHQHQHHHHHNPTPQNPLANNPILENLHAILRQADRNAAPPIQNNVAPITGAERVPSNPLPTSSTAAHTQSALRPLVPPAPVPNSPAPSLSPNPAVQLPLYNTAIPSTSAPVVPVISNPTENPPDGAGPMVYILSSPHGPRALLLSTNSETFYTPRQPSRRRRQEMAIPANGVVPQIDGRGLPMPVLRNPDRRRVRQERFGYAQPEQQNPPLAHAAAHAHANPGAGALAAQIGPLVWLFVRLAGFVWFFTAGNSSWLRFFMVSAFALGIFIVNTGLLTGVFEQLWGPIRRHVETLIPLAGPDAALVPAQNARIPPAPPQAEAAAAAPAENRPARRRRPGELDPAEVAARLIEQHRQANGGWLMAQMRRAEHAALLFLASLIPGVGERHIAAREAEAAAAEAERLRVEAEAAAAEDAEAEAENAQATTQQTTDGGDNEGGQEAPQAREGDAPLQPLVEV